MVDFPKVMARLKQGGFTSGPLIIETLAPGELPQLIAEAKRAREFVEKLVAQAWTTPLGHLGHLGQLGCF